MKKKICFLICTIFFLTGCFDYHELNDRAIIVGIALDYQDEQFIVNFEVLSGQKSENNQGNAQKSYLIEGQAKTLSKAYQNAFLHLDKDPYYAHLKVLIFGEEVAKNHLKQTIDYLIRDPDTRNIFYPVIAKESTAKEILAATSTEAPIVSEAIQGLIENKDSKESIATELNFEKFLDLLLDSKKDAYTNTIQLKEKKLTLDGLSIFQEYTLKNTLTINETSITKLLNNDSQSYYLNLSCPNKENEYLTISLYDNKKTDFEISDQEIKIIGEYNANIIEDNCGYNFEDTKTYTTLAEQFQKKLDDNSILMTKKIMNSQSDILGIQKKYYIKTKKELPNWDQLEVSSKSTIHINKNGIVFEVNDHD